jgi:hypothetical protein
MLFLCSSDIKTSDPLNLLDDAAVTHDGDNGHSGLVHFPGGDVFSQNASLYSLWKHCICTKMERSTADLGTEDCQLCVVRKIKIVVMIVTIRI